MPYADPVVHAEHQREYVRRKKARPVLKPNPGVTEPRGRGPRDPDAPRKKRVGNPNWGKPLDSLMPYPNTPTAFENQVERLGLASAAYQTSKELRSWTRLNYKTRYVPEALLDLWGLSLDSDYP